MCDKRNKKMKGRRGILNVVGEREIIREGGRERIKL